MIPMATLAAITARPSHTYGRHHTSSPHNTAIQMPQATVEKARMRPMAGEATRDRKSTRLNSSHGYISYAVFCLKKKKKNKNTKFCAKIQQENYLADMD